MKIIDYDQTFNLLISVNINMHSCWLLRLMKSNQSNVDILLILICMYGLPLRTEDLSIIV